jgi:broad specificity phosphatase PhoE
MKNIALFFILSVCQLTAFGQKGAITTFILVRHAEKVADGSKDPELKPEGNERAARLAAMLKQTKVDAIYSTDFRRTKNTVLPYATEKNLSLNIYEAFKETELENMLKKHAGGTVLISGHSNNIPWIANRLLGKEEYGDFADDDYGNLLIISVVEKGNVVKVTQLRY